MYLTPDPELSPRSLKSSTFTSFPQNSPHSYSQDHCSGARISIGAKEDILDMLMIVFIKFWPV